MLHKNVRKVFEAYWKKVSWKKHEINILKKYWKTLTDIEINEKYLPNRTEISIRNRRFALGLKKTMVRHQIWTPEEIATLKENYLKYNQRELQQLFFPNKTISQIRNAKMSRGLKKPPVWTNEERGLLIDHGADYSSRDLKRMFFKNKTTNQIAWMRKHLGIRRNKVKAHG